MINVLFVISVFVKMRSVVQFYYSKMRGKTVNGRKVQCQFPVHGGSSSSRRGRG